MDKINQTGKLLRKTAVETEHNTRRISENFIKPERVLGYLNKIHSYKMEFTQPNFSAALLNLKFRELVIPCTVNPPTLNVSCSIKFDSDNPGFFREPLVSTTNLNSPERDFSFTTAGVRVPVDGCYSVLWQSPAWGPSYFRDKHVTVALQHNGYTFRSVVQGSTGGIFILGPTIYIYTPASPIYAVIECKAGDTIGAYMTQADLPETYPWYNGGLGGFFLSYGEWAADIKIELIAVAEG